MVAGSKASTRVRRRVPSAIWPTVGILASGIVFLSIPMIVTPERSWSWLPHVPPGASPGADLAATIGFSREWFLEDRSPWGTARGFSPFAQLIFAAFMPLPFVASYGTVSLLTLLSHAFAVLAFPSLIGVSRPWSLLAVFLLVTGFVSYGLHFELERGQFNLIAMALTLLAVWVSHGRPRWKLVAYLLFSTAVQLKIWPAIFFVCLADVARGARDAVRAVMWVACINIALLFVLGYRAALAFLPSIAAAAGGQEGSFVNHSARSFTRLSESLAPANGEDSLLVWLATHPALVEPGILAVFGGCFAIAVWHAYRAGGAGIRGPLLLMCSLGALVVPSMSQDYKLAVLTGPLLVFWCYETRPDASRWILNASRVFLTITGMCYGATLFSFSNKVHLVLLNNLPTLVVLMLATTGWILCDLHGSRAPRSLTTPVAGEQHMR